MNTPKPRERRTLPYQLMPTLRLSAIPHLSPIARKSTKIDGSPQGPRGRETRKWRRRQNDRLADRIAYVAYKKRMGNLTDMSPRAGDVERPHQSEIHGCPDSGSIAASMTAQRDAQFRDLSCRTREILAPRNTQEVAPAGLSLSQGHLPAYLLAKGICTGWSSENRSNDCAHGTIVGGVLKG
ncbi:hypothetical protein EAG_09157 [Camponotus floridanus]|uniref:Uncharacterized protein n=1 Tax=Camponotus floridanus TaxID=104421 RepID=E2AI57_CAMFO|nr:hypothetical protein EAG_09157 [Camponotus floridanus]